LDWQGEDAAELPKSLVCKVPSVLTMVRIGQSSGYEEKWDNIQKEEGTVDYDKDKAMQFLEKMIETVSMNTTSDMACCFGLLTVEKFFKSSENNSVGCILLSNMSSNSVLMSEILNFT
jgi:hypothetical protein